MKFYSDLAGLVFGLPTLGVTGHSARVTGARMAATRNGSYRSLVERKRSCPWGSGTSRTRPDHRVTTPLLSLVRSRREKGGSKDQNMQVLSKVVSEYSSGRVTLPDGRQAQHKFQPLLAATVNFQPRTRPTEVWTCVQVANGITCVWDHQREVGRCTSRCKGPLAVCTLREKRKKLEGSSGGSRFALRVVVDVTPTGKHGKVANSVVDTTGSSSQCCRNIRQLHRD